MEDSSGSDDKSNSSINSKENDDEYQSAFDADSTVPLSEKTQSQRSSVKGNPGEAKEVKDSTELDELVRKAAFFDLINKADNATKAVLLGLLTPQQNQVISTAVEDNLAQRYNSVPKHFHNTLLDRRSNVVMYSASEGLDLTPVQRTKQREFAPVDELYADRDPVVPYELLCYKLWILISTIYHLNCFYRNKSFLSQIGRGILAGDMIVVRDLNEVGEISTLLTHESLEDMRQQLFAYIRYSEDDIRMNKKATINEPDFQRDYGFFAYTSKQYVNNLKQWDPSHNQEDFSDVVNSHELLPQWYVRFREFRLRVKVTRTWCRLYLSQELEVANRNPQCQFDVDNLPLWCDNYIAYSEYERVVSVIHEPKKNLKCVNHKERREYLLEQGLQKGKEMAIEAFANYCAERDDENSENKKKFEAMAMGEMEEWSTTKIGYSQAFQARLDGIESKAKKSKVEEDDFGKRVPPRPIFHNLPIYSPMSSPPRPSIRASSSGPMARAMTKADISSSPYPYRSNAYHNDSPEHAQMQALKLQVSHLQEALMQTEAELRVRGTTSPFSGYNTTRDGTGNILRNSSSSLNINLSDRSLIPEDIILPKSAFAGKPTFEAIKQIIEADLQYTRYLRELSTTPGCVIKHPFLCIKDEELCKKIARKEYCWNAANWDLLRSADISTVEDASRFQLYTPYYTWEVIYRACAPKALPEMLTFIESIVYTEADAESQEATKRWLTIVERCVLICQGKFHPVAT